MQADGIVTVRPIRTDVETRVRYILYERLSTGDGEDHDAENDAPRETGRVVAV